MFRKIIKDNDAGRRCKRQQPLGQMAADETCASADKYYLHGVMMRDGGRSWPGPPSAIATVGK